ncbi:MAG: GNAT family N-acetyltransferase [Chloroflexota bacterium]
MHILLTTERLILRRFTEADAQNLFELDNDPEVMRYINGGTPTPFEIIKDDILPSFITYDPDYPEFGFWAVQEKAGQGFVGWFSFRPANGNHSDIVLGYRFHQAVWGKGYATEGAQALINLGFGELGIECVIATTYEENMASRRVMEKLGMTFKRAFRLTPEDIQSSDTSYSDSDDVWDGDDVEYSIERAEWESKASPAG